MNYSHGLIHKYEHFLMKAAPNINPPNDYFVFLRMWCVRFLPSPCSVELDFAFRKVRVGFVLNKSVDFTPQAMPDNDGALNVLMKNPLR